MIKYESIDILRAAKEALADVYSGDIEKSVDLIGHICSSSDVELEQIMHKLQVESEIKESKILFF